MQACCSSAAGAMNLTAFVGWLGARGSAGIVQAFTDEAVPMIPPSHCLCWCWRGTQQRLTAIAPGMTGTSCHSFAQSMHTSVFSNDVVTQCRSAYCSLHTGPVWLRDRGVSTPSNAIKCESSSAVGIYRSCGMKKAAMFLQQLCIAVVMLLVQ